MSEPKGVTLEDVASDHDGGCEEGTCTVCDRERLKAAKARAADRVVAAARNSFHIPLCKCDVCEALADFDRAGGGA